MTGTSRAAMRRRSAAATVSAAPAPSIPPVAQAAQVAPVSEPVVSTAPDLADAAPVAAPLSRRARRATIVAPAAPVPAIASDAVVVADAPALDEVPAVDEAPQDVDADAASALIAETVAAFAAAAAEPSSAVAVPTPMPAKRRRVRSNNSEAASVDTVEELRVVEPAPAPVTSPSEIFVALPVEGPVAAPQLEAPAAEPAPAEQSVDEFEAAARLFSFTGETPVQQAAPAAEPTPETAPHVAPRRAKAARGVSFKKVATASFSVGVFGIVGLMAVGMTTPAEAVAAVGGADTSMSVVAPAGGASASTIDADEIQAYVAPAGVQSDTLERTENYGTTTTAELASEAGIQNFSNLFHNDPNAPIQWPFAVGVTMSYGFGMRDGRMHEGIDFTPGAGSPVQAIADGTVRVASESGGAYGVHVIIDHIIDGELVSSHYAHMQYGSLEVVPGQHVTVGTVIGHTGNTGRSFGAHTHFEILQNGTTAIDPMPWLREHAGG